VIAMINGHAHVAGCNLALGCDLRVIAGDATLSIPFSRRGIGTGTNLLQQFVGIGKAMECMQSRRPSVAPSPHNRDSTGRRSRPSHYTATLAGVSATQAANGAGAPT
jgi:enoyl-CoA hydratase/carnithine racemase